MSDETPTVNLTKEPPEPTQEQRLRVEEFAASRVCLDHAVSVADSAAVNRILTWDNDSETYSGQLKGLPPIVHAIGDWVLRSRQSIAGLFGEAIMNEGPVEVAAKVATVYGMFGFFAGMSYSHAEFQGAETIALPEGAVEAIQKEMRENGHKILALLGEVQLSEDEPPCTCGVCKIKNGEITDPAEIRRVLKAEVTKKYGENFVIPMEIPEGAGDDPDAMTGLYL